MHFIARFLGKGKTAAQSEPSLDSIIHY